MQSPAELVGILKDNSIQLVKMVQANLMSALAAAALWSRLAFGQVSSDCNPLSSSNCSPNKALATSFAEDFSDESDWFESQNDTGEINYGSDGLEMTLAKRYDNPGLKSTFYIMYGKVEAILKAGPGTGIVSSFFLQSDDLDEIDLEWIGSDDTQFQSNFFSKGDVTTYDRGAFHGVSEPQAEFHNYTIDWAMDKTVWYLDGQPVRTLENTTSEGYPQSPMFLKMGIWAGGDPSNAPGTIEWAGGSVDYSQAPFSMYIKKVVVTDYSSGSEYSYGDQSGFWESIEAKDGSVYGRYDVAQQEFAALANGEDISTSSSTSSSASSSSSSSSSTSSSASSSSSSSSSTSSSASSSSSSSSSTSSSASSSSSSSSSTSSSTSASFTSSSASSSASSTSSSTASSAFSSSESSTTASVSSTSEVSSSATSASSEVSSTSTSEVSSSSESAQTTSTEAASSEAPSSSDSTQTTSPEVSSTSTTAASEPTTTEEPSTLTTSTSTQDATQSSSAASVQLSNHAMNLGYSHGLTGLVAGFALALVY